MAANLLNHEQKTIFREPTEKKLQAMQFLFTFAVTMSSEHPADTIAWLASYRQLY